MTLPKGWTKAALGEFTLERVEQREPGASAVPYIDIGSIDRDSKRVGPTEKVTRATAPTRARQRVKAGDVLVSLTRPNLNAVAMVPPELDGAVASTGFDVLRPEGVLAEWVFNRVRSQVFVSDVCEGVQGVVYPAIRPADVRRHDLPIPPAQEQRRIVEAIDSHFSRLDAAVASLERVQSKLKSYRVSVLKAAVEGRLVPTEASIARAEKREYEPAEVLLARILEERRRRWEEAELIKLKAAGKTPKDDRWKAKYDEPVAPDTSTLQHLPEGWCWATVEQVAQLVTDGDHNPPRRVSSGVPHLTAKHIKKWRILFEGSSFVSPEGFEQTRGRYEPREGDVIVTCVGTVGETAVVPPGCVFSADRNLAAIRLMSGGAFPAFVMYLLSSPDLKQRLKTSSGATAQPHLYLGDLRALPVPIPPRPEQDRIVLEIERLLSLVDSSEVLVVAGAKRISRLRQAILRLAFEGKLVDQDTNDEPANKLLARIRAERTDSLIKKTARRQARGAA